MKYFHAKSITRYIRHKNWLHYKLSTVQFTLLSLFCDNINNWRWAKFLLRSSIWPYFLKVKHINIKKIIIKSVILDLKKINYYLNFFYIKIFVFVRNTISYFSRCANLSILVFLLSSFSFKTLAFFSVYLL